MMFFILILSSMCASANLWAMGEPESPRAGAFLAISRSQFPRPSSIRNNLWNLGDKKVPLLPRSESPEIDAGCAVCLEEQLSNPIWLKQCKHAFCKECIREWLQRNETCPMCRASVVHEQPVRRSSRWAAYVCPLCVSLGEEDTPLERSVRCGVVMGSVWAGGNLAWRAAELFCALGAFF